MTLIVFDDLCYRHIGDEFNALYYSKDIVLPMTTSPEYQTAHLLYIFRDGSTVAQISLSGFPHVLSHLLHAFYG